MKTSIHHSFIMHITWGLVFGCLLGACQPVMTPPPNTETPSPTLMEVTIATPEPAKPTSTPVVHTLVPPTPEVIMPAGELLFEETFADGKTWKSDADANGNIIAGGEKLTLAVKSNMGTLSTFRGERLPDNYYLEVTAEVRLCRGNDTFGILFRAPDDQTGYRFLIDSNRMITLQQVIGGTANPIVDWVQSPALEPGLPYPMHIGILASGKTIRIYLNQVLQIEIEKGLFYSGSLGFFAHAAGDTPLTVNFSELKLYKPPD